MIHPKTLIIPSTRYSESCLVNIPFGSGSRIAMRGKFFKIYLIKGTYHYTYKGVSFYRSKQVDIHIINILANSVALKYVEPTKEQLSISNIIKSRILTYKIQNQSWELHF